MVDNKGEFVREYVVNGKKIKEAIYSPFRQAQRHIEIMKKGWLQRQNKLSILLFEKNYTNWYRPLVVFSNPKGILNIKRTVLKKSDCNSAFRERFSFVVKYGLLTYSRYSHVVILIVESWNHII